MLAPIALFVYNRPHHTSQVLEALKSNTLANQSSLFIFSDGPPQDASNELISNVKAVRELLHKKEWCKNISIHEQPTNMGLANSIISGISSVLKTYDRIIVLEDDIVPSSSFLSFMNQALTLYEAETQVISISSFNFFAKSKQIPDYFFSPIIDCWGWATWRRGWDMFEKDGKKLIGDIDNRGLREEFNVNGAYDYYNMLERASNNRVDSWAIRWYASGFIHGKVSLYPKVSLTKNIGFDGSGINSNTHEFKSAFNVATHYPKLEKAIVQNDPNALKEFYQYFNQPRRNSFKILVTILISRAKIFIKRLAGKI